MSIINIIGYNNKNIADVNISKELMVIDTDANTSLSALLVALNQFKFTGDDLEVIEVNSSLILTELETISAGLGGGVTLSFARINETTVGTKTIISAVADQTIKIYGISLHNNEATESNDVILTLFDSTPSIIYGNGGTQGIYLPGRGGVWGLPNSNTPYYELGTNKAFQLSMNVARSLSGVVWYVQD